MNSAKVKNLIHNPATEHPRKEVDHNQLVEVRGWLGWLSWLGTVAYIIFDKLN